MLKLISKKTKDLKQSEIIHICKLKNTQWKYSFKSQLFWFRKNNFKSDIHNLLLFDKKIIGYTSLRVRYYEHSNYKSKFLLFDSLIINRKFRKKNYSTLLMNFNNKTIISKKKFSFLICEKKMVDFYKKFKWNKMIKLTYKILDHSTAKIGMVFNKDKLKNSKKKVNLNFKK
jgi:hypothetical protein